MKDERREEGVKQGRREKGIVGERNRAKRGQVLGRREDRGREGDGGRRRGRREGKN